MSEHSKTPQERIRTATRKRLKIMEKSGNILDWDFIPGEPTFYMTLPNGTEIVASPNEVAFFQLGILSNLVQATGLGNVSLENALRGIRKSEKELEQKEA